VGAFRTNPVHPHGSNDVLDLLLAEIDNGEAEAVAHLLVRRRTEADPARLGQGFEPGGDVDAAAQDVAILDDDVADIDAHANSSRRSEGVAALRVIISRCTSTAQRTASTTLANSTRRPSPVVLTMRPRCSAILGSPSSRRTAGSAASVPSSSAPISRDQPATSTARMAANRRSTRPSLIWPVP
jgi:hypothetical protein